MAIAAGIVLFGGFFRQDREIRLLTIIYGIAMCLLWVIIAARHLPVAWTCESFSCLLGRVATRQVEPRSGVSM